MTTKSKLHTTLAFQFELVGIVCECREYRMAWLINQTLNIDLEKQPEGILSFRRGGSLYFTQYVFENDFEQIRLIKNKAAEPVHSALYLLPELKELDYFLLLNNEVNDQLHRTYVEALNACSMIRLVRPLDVQSLPSRENLLI